MIHVVSFFSVIERASDTYQGTLIVVWTCGEEWLRYRYVIIKKLERMVAWFNSSCVKKMHCPCQQIKPSGKYFTVHCLFINVLATVLVWTTMCNRFRVCLCNYYYSQSRERSEGRALRVPLNLHLHNNKELWDENKRKIGEITNSPAVLIRCDW